MSLKEMISDPKEHIMEGRKIAEKLNSMKPEDAMEQFAEIKRYWIKLKEKSIERISGL